MNTHKPYLARLRKIAWLYAYAELTKNDVTIKSTK